MPKFTAFVLVTVEAGEVFLVRDTIVNLPNTSFAHCVTGAFDIIAKIEADTFNDLVGETVIERIQKIRGVRQTATCIVVPEERVEAYHSET